MAKNITEKKLVRQHREHAARVGVAAVQILCSSSLSPFRRRLNLAETVSASWYARYKYIEDATGLTGVAAAREVWDPHIGQAHDELGDSGALVQEFVRRLWPEVLLRAGQIARGEHDPYREAFGANYDGFAA
ncbi:hypothetical protein [Mycobacteroides abscessus]|uniref:hypothetical protein n=1 Tax=Mycobacteroides abscessus TaxID=36809 RepID=UPI0009294116|nr:hypothetical protein [Mycobacteroides abscessus]MBE5451283.1 hypothetical protein [Mycobacteroides abscessus]MDO3212595.1 hypothetical protein [Mycobacteroides abscessus subsp. abscessus]MDO3352064.1 hypothetical protein [Mycobacteroides abscessus subsp. abscessus]PVA12421.1 hypothetical protein DDJ61_22770 [Mycobacteroides abscessus]PVA74404.1 hypothetical protein DDJ76_22535 [Mycobacteroides abscessus]